MHMHTHTRTSLYLSLFVSILPVQSRRLRVHELRTKYTSLEPWIKLDDSVIVKLGWMTKIGASSKAMQQQTINATTIDLC